jgi:formyltetrahydrofolate hydrolase
MKKLPIGISDFKELINGNYIYVDKTEYIYKLINSGKYYFLSRPRRFGKSLLISTIRYLFEGQKELFKNLYIQDKWNWDETFPIIRISFAKDIRHKQDLKNTIFQELEKNYIRNQENLPEKIKNEASLLENLIIKISEKKRKQVVILVDEYDKPILDLIENKKKAEDVRKELKALYSVLKNLDEHIKFVLITGVSKFSKVSLFSGLNQLEDISLNKDFGNICGYTQQELEFYFKDYLQGLNLDEIKQWYNGYYFLGDKLYNPFDILLYLKNKVFRNYWYETGTPQFIIKLIKEKEYNIVELENIRVDEGILNKFDIEDIAIEAIMFQTGYLTIKKSIESIYGEEYILCFPNKEVKIAFNKNIMELLLKSPKLVNNLAFKIREILIKEQIEKLKAEIDTLISNISYMYLKEEASYVLAVFVLLYSSGLNVITEDNTSKGRIDLTIIVNNSIVYILEFKVIQNSKEKGNAIKQILEKEYYKKYLNYDKVYIVGIELNKTKKQIVNFEYQQVK